MRKKLRSELDQKEIEFKGLVKDGFSLNDDFMVDLLQDIEAKRRAKQAEQEAKKKANEAPAPPYIKDVNWSGGPNLVNGSVVHPHVGGKGITKRDFAMFSGAAGEATYQMVMASIRWKQSPTELWRMVAIHIMAWELAEAKQTFPTPSWLDLQAYAPRRYRTTEEAMEDHISGADDGLSVEPEPEKAPRKKRPTKRDLLDAKYAELMKMLK